MSHWVYNNTSFYRKLTWESVLKIYEWTNSRSVIVELFLLRRPFCLPLRKRLHGYAALWTKAVPAPCPWERICDTGWPLSTACLWPKALVQRKLKAGGTDSSGRTDWLTGLLGRGDVSRKLLLASPAKVSPRIRPHRDKEGWDMESHRLDLAFPWIQLPSRLRFIHGLTENVHQYLLFYA